MQINVLEYFEATIKKSPEKIAVIDNKKSYTFNELAKTAKTLAAQLIQKNNPFKSPIAVFLPKSAESLTAFLGILYSGNFYVPLDIKSPKARIKSIVENLQPLLIITSVEYYDLLSSMDLIGIDILSISNHGIIENYENNYPNRLNSLIDTDPVYIIYTSGSTGVPKGVTIPHRGVIDYIDWAVNCFEIDENTIIGSQSPFYFDNSTLDFYLCLATGATLVLIPEQLFAFPIKLMEYVAETKINFIFWVPSVLINVANTNILSRVQLPYLKKILFAGEVMPNKHLNYWRKVLPDALFANLYGPTEITVDCTYYIVEREFNDNDPLPIGFPCRNSDIIILNDQNQPVGINDIGELCVRGSSLALGYWNDLEKTNAAFTQNPLNQHYSEKIYRTGDLVSINECNEIIYLGRKDSQIKHMGYRIELGEIETAVLSIGAIENACVLYNKVKQEITLFYKSKEDLTIDVIRKYLQPLLPKYMIPTAFYRLDKLPLNPNGKIDRLALTSQYFY